MTHVYGKYHNLGCVCVCGGGVQQIRWVAVVCPLPGGAGVYLDEVYLLEDPLPPYLLPGAALL